VRLADVERRSNALESRFDLAYNAAHALSLAALRYAGYRAANRYVVFQALPHTLGLGPEVWRVLAKGHEIRNRSEYEGDFYADERLLADLSDGDDDLRRHAVLLADLGQELAMLGGELAPAAHHPRRRAAPEVRLERLGPLGLTAIARDHARGSGVRPASVWSSSSSL
jgi:hypothetical protein